LEEVVSGVGVRVSAQPLAALTYILLILNNKSSLTLLIALGLNLPV